MRPESSGPAPSARSGFAPPAATRSRSGPAWRARPRESVMHHPSPNEIEAELAQIAARWNDPDVDLDELVERKRREQGIVSSAGAQPLVGMRQRERLPAS